MMRAASFAYCIAFLLLAGLAPARAQAPQTQTSSELVRADPGGQYVLIKTVVGQTGGIAARPAPTANPDGYDVLAYCWAPYHVLGEWAVRSELTGKLVVMALETLAWARDLGRGGYPPEPLNAAIGHYEAAMIASGLTDAARERAIDAFRSELETIARGATGAVKTRKHGGCGGPGPAVQLRYETAPKEGHVSFIPKLLHEICRAQQFAADDLTRCDYWAAGKETEPPAFVGEIVWLARWSDGIVTRGAFDSRTVAEPGIVTLRQRK